MYNSVWSNINKILITLCLVIFSFSSGNAAVIDTTKVRKTEKIKKTTTEVIGDIPGEIIKLPFYIIDYTIEQITFNPPVENLISWIGTPRPPSFYTPVLGYNSTAGFKFGIALKFKNVYSQNDYLKSKFYYTTNKYQSYQFQLKSNDMIKKDIGLDFNFRYKKRPREKFYGLGNSSSESLTANYNLENTEVSVKFPINLFKVSSFVLAFGFRSTNLYNGEDPDIPGNLDSIIVSTGYQLTDGHLDNSRFFTYGIVFEFDRRNSKSQPSEGVHLISSVTRYTGVDFSDNLHFTEYSIDVRQYLHLWKKRILAFRAVMQRLNADDGNLKPAPVYLLSNLGGDENLRGFSSGRFIDNDFALFSIEYRYPIYDFIDIFLFNDQARVFNNITDEQLFTAWKSSFGGGLRIWKNDDVKAVVQIAKSNETTKVYLEMEAIW